MRRFRDKRLYERGRFIWARVRDANGYIVRVSTQCTDEKAATAFADEWERKAVDPGYRRAAEATLGLGIGEWLAEQVRRNSSSVVRDITKKKLGHFVRLWGEDWPLLRISNDLVLAYIDQRSKEPGATRGSTVKRLTIKRELDHLRRMLEWAKFRGMFPLDIGTVIPPGFSGKHKPRTRAPSPEEVVRLLQNLTLHRAAHVAFIVASGARRAEAFRACRGDVDLKALTIRVRGTKTERAADAVPITGLTHALVIFALQNAPSDDPLFAPWGKLNRDLAAACVRAGIDRVSPNDLRRAYGKWHRLSGLSAEHVGLMLRHTTSTLAQTTYAKISAADVGDDIRTRVPVLFNERENDDASLSERGRVLDEAAGRSPRFDEAARSGQGRGGGDRDDRTGASAGHVPFHEGDDLRDRGDWLGSSEDRLDSYDSRATPKGSPDRLPVPPSGSRHHDRPATRRVEDSSPATPAPGGRGDGVVPPDPRGGGVDPRVPDLYVRTAQTTDSDPNTDDDPPQKQASPAEFESATPGLGNQGADGALSPRSVGNKLAHARRRQAHIVPEAYGPGDCRAFRGLALRWLTKEAA